MDFHLRSKHGLTKPSESEDTEQASRKAKDGDGGKIVKQNCFQVVSRSPEEWMTRQVVLDGLSLRQKKIIGIDKILVSTKYWLNKILAPNANILSMLIFCRHQHFVEANILSTLIFGRCQYFVDTNILLTPIFC
jgi:hypothetical protein